MGFFDAKFRIYAKPILNNPADEPVFIGTFEARTKQDAIHTARNAPENRGIYKNDSFFGVCHVLGFEQEDNQ